MTIEVVHNGIKTSFEFGAGTLPCTITKNLLVLEVLDDLSFKIFDLCSTRLLYQGNFEPIKENAAA